MHKLDTVIELGIDLVCAKTESNSKYSVFRQNLVFSGQWMSSDA